MPLDRHQYCHFSHTIRQTFFSDLVLVFGVIILDLLIISVRLFKMLSSFWSAIADFRLDIACIVLLMCCTTDISLEFPTILTLLFCSFSFQISLESSVSVLYFLFLKDFRLFAYRDLNLWSHWCRSKFYFYNSLSSMLYLPCTKRYYWETYCLRAFGFVCTVTCSCLSWRFCFCHFLVMYIDS